MFIIFTLLSLPCDSNGESSSIMNLSRNVEVDQMLNQPAEKAIRKEDDSKEIQAILKDFLVFITNVIVLGRFLLNIKLNNAPTILNILMDVADFISSIEYNFFDGNYKKSTKFMTHTSVVCIFIIFVVSIKAAKYSNMFREFKVDNTAKFKHLRIDTII